MFKPCPNCGFLVALIAGREASQRCPRCGSALMGDGETVEIVDDGPRRRRGDAVVDDAAAAIATGQVMPVDDQAIPTPSTPIDAAPDTIVPAIEPAPIVEAKPHDGPSFTRRHAPARRGRRWPWAVAVVGLALLLALQLVLAQRNELARDAQWRPLVARVCGVLGCRVPDWREPKAFRMLGHTVRPSRSGVLHASTTLRNDARWPQPPPVVVLSLSDVDGRLLGARALRPVDYGRSTSALVPPGESIDIAFDVREPSGRVEAYDFQLQ